MKTLEQLKSGQLKGTKKLKLACGLKKFPKEIFSLSETLEILDMTDNQLQTLPDDFGKLKKLKILFLSNNLFEEVPTVLANCPKLSMIGFRNNRIKTLAEDALPLSTRWLILTDNLLERLPESIGKLKHLQKCMLSGNLLTALPQSLSKCHNLELLRVSSNRLTAFPSVLLALPKLSWLAYSGNPFCMQHPSCKAPLKEIPWRELIIKESLGEGASGEIFKALWKNKEVAIKLFKAEMTSDGLPQEEMNIHIAIGRHPHLIEVLGRIIGHPEGKDALIMALIPPDFYNLGLPPTFESCTRDIYPDNTTFTLKEVLKILKGIAGAAAHIHQRGIMHGDLYAHNIMIDAKAHAILGDFGGASYYDPKEHHIHQALERLEIRAFGYLIEELLLLSQSDISNEKIKSQLMIIKEHCLSPKHQNRPFFSEVQKSISNLYLSI